MPIIKLIKYHLRTLLITITSLCLFLFLLQTASILGLNAQAVRSDQVDQLARILTRQVAIGLFPLLKMDDGSDLIAQQLDKLTQEARILDASVYRMDGALIAHSGDTTHVRDRLGLDGSQRRAMLNRQMVEIISENNTPLGFLRLTLDTHVQSTDDQLIDNTTNMIRLMLLSALLIGIVITHTLFKDRSLITDSQRITGFPRLSKSATEIKLPVSTPSIPSSPPHLLLANRASDNSSTNLCGTSALDSELSTTHAKLKQRRRRRIPARKTHYRR
ncbi:MAG: AhpA/YtjB family protein [Plesiomonas sp.]|uniref:AhpA/YtjB family protein n=1 Tax=Plesiomonas sp. TaxID=2486279 RepID=UPI003F3E94E2